MYYNSTYQAMMYTVGSTCILPITYPLRNAAEVSSDKEGDIRHYVCHANIRSLPEWCSVYYQE